jgi:hypothetical protein
MWGVVNTVGTSATPIRCGPVPRGRFHGAGLIARCNEFGDPLRVAQPPLSFQIPSCRAVRINNKIDRRRAIASAV